MITAGLACTTEDEALGSSTKSASKRGRPKSKAKPKEGQFHFFHHIVQLIAPQNVFAYHVADQVTATKSAWLSCLFKGKTFVLTQGAHPDQDKQKDLNTSMTSALESETETEAAAQEVPTGFARSVVARAITDNGGKDMVFSARLIPPSKPHQCPFCKYLLRWQSPSFTQWCDVKPIFVLMEMADRAGDGSTKLQINF